LPAEGHELQILMLLLPEKLVLQAGTVTPGFLFDNILEIVPFPQTPTIFF
jgi:hypothetical protein